MSGVDYYVALLHNPTRLRAFRAGIEAAVRPGDSVLDLGTGVGTYALFAALAGAGHVWAVDRSRVVRVGRAMAGSHGLADRITFLHGEVPGVELPSGLDVLVFEDFASSLLETSTWDVLASIYPKLAPGARTVPLSARLVMAPVHAPRLRERFLPPAPGAGDMGLDWAPLRALAANTPVQVALAPELLVAPPIPSEVIPLLPLPTARQLRVEGAWVAPEATGVHGLALWFDLELAPGVRLSNEPSAAPEPWRQLFLPLDPPLEVPAGARVEAAVWRDGTPEGRPEWLAWDVSAAGERRRGHEFAGQPLAVEDLLPGGARPEPR